VGQAEDRLVAGVVGLDESGAVGQLEARAVEHPFGQPGGHRLTARDLLDDGPAPPVCGDQARLHQLREPPGRLERTVPPPDVVPPDQAAVDQGRVEHLAHEQWSAAGVPPDPPARDRVDLTAERRLEHGGDHRPVQRLQLDAFDQAVLPERRDRVGAGLAESNRQQERGMPRDHQVVEKRDRRIVEEVRVVDDHDRRPVGRGRRVAHHPGEGTSGVAEQREAVIAHGRLVG
jgi:hypothetical protein